MPSSIPFQNSCLAGRGGYRPRVGCFIGCRNRLDVRGNGGLVWDRWWSCYRGARREDENYARSLLMLYQLIDIAPRDNQNDGGPFRPLAELSWSLAVELFEHRREVCDVFSRDELAYLSAFSCSSTLGQSAALITPETRFRVLTYRLIDGLKYNPHT